MFFGEAEILAFYAATRARGSIDIHPMSLRAKPLVPIPGSESELLKLDFANAGRGEGIEGFEQTDMKDLKKCSDSQGPEEPPLESEANVPSEATLGELSKPGRPDDGWASDYYESIEHKEGEPYKPNEENGLLIDTRDDEPKGSTAPDDRRRAAKSAPLDFEYQPCGPTQEGPKFDIITEPIQPILEFQDEKKGNQDFDAFPGIMQALFDELILSLQGKGITLDGDDRPPQPRSQSPERPNRCALAS